MTLLPCPECGNQPKLNSLEPDKQCMKYFCGVHASCGDWEKSEELAAEDWNRRVKEYQEESQKIRVPLKKALFILLYDQYESVDMEVEQSDEEYVNYIVDALIQANGSTCPFKNYDCIQRCKLNAAKCNEGLLINCDNELEKIWKEFMLA